MLKYFLLSIFIIAFLVSLVIPYQFTVTGDSEISQPVPDESVSSTSSRRQALVETASYKIITAYNADPAQTDSSPDITASGKKVKEGYIAYNCAKFGTKVEIGGKEYIVEDRMNKKYGCSRMDIFMDDYDSAITFGKQTLPIKIYDKKRNTIFQRDDQHQK